MPAEDLINYVSTPTMCVNKSQRRRKRSNSNVRTFDSLLTLGGGGESTFQRLAGMIQLDIITNKIIK